MARIKASKVAAFVKTLNLNIDNSTASGISVGTLLNMGRRIDRNIAYAHVTDNYKNANLALKQAGFTRVHDAEEDGHWRCAQGTVIVERRNGGALLIILG